MNFIILIRLLLIFTVIPNGSARVKYPRWCKQCVSGDYLNMRWMMQNRDVRQRVDWKNDWKTEDCDADKEIKIGCDGACMTVEVQKRNGTNVLGYMRGCSDDLIHDNPDVPKGVFFNNFVENGTFTIERQNHIIVYKFSTVGIKNAHALNETWQTSEAPPMCMFLLLWFIPLACFCIFVHCYSWEVYFMDRRNASRNMRSRSEAQEDKSQSRVPESKTDTPQY